MKKRLTTVLNFFAFNLLFFALYLNFIHKDNNTQVVLPTQQSTASVQRTVVVSNPFQYINKTKEDQSSLQKLSYN
jgi:hypothetical protein